MTMQSAGVSRSRLYRSTAVLAVLMCLLMLGQVVFAVLVTPPQQAIDWFSLFDWNALLGLLSFELLMVLYALLSIPVSIALFVALAGAPAPLRWGFLLLAVTSALAFVAARPMWEMWDLTRQFAAATNDGEAKYLVEAGTRLLGSFSGPAYQLSYYTGALSGLLLGIALWRRPVFGRTAAALRFVSSVLDFGILVPGAGVFAVALSLVALLVFNGLVARGCLRLARETATPVPPP
jgi:hypothetical protein